MCIVLSVFLVGCKEKEQVASVFDGLPESAYITEIKTALENNKPLVIAFTAEWCPHCRAYKPIFFEVKKEVEDKCYFINIDVDDSNGSSLSKRFNVGGIPTTAFVRPDGSVFKVQVGEISKEDLIKLVDDLVASKKRKRGESIAPFPIEKKQVEEEKPKEEPPQEIIEEKPSGETETEPATESMPAVEETKPEKPAETSPPVDKSSLDESGSVEAVPPDSNQEEPTNEQENSP